MKKMIIAATLAFASLAHADEIKMWPEQARCSARFSALKVNEPDLRKALLNSEQHALVTLEKGGYGSASATLTFSFPEANAAVEVRVSLSNSDFQGKPKTEKNLTVNASLLIDSKLVGVVGVLQKGKSTDSHIINGFSLTNPENEIVHQYRFANPDKKLNVQNATKELFPGKEVLANDVYISCTAVPYEQTPVDPKF